MSWGVAKHKFVELGFTRTSKLASVAIMEQELVISERGVSWVVCEASVEHIGTGWKNAVRGLLNAAGYQQRKYALRRLEQHGISIVLGLAIRLRDAVTVKQRHNISHMIVNAPMFLRAICCWHWSQRVGAEGGDGE